MMVVMKIKKKTDDDDGWRGRLCSHQAVVADYRSDNGYERDKNSEDDVKCIDETR